MTEAAKTGRGTAHRLPILRLMRDGLALLRRSGSGVLLYSLLFSGVSGIVVLFPLLELLQFLGRLEDSSIVGNYTIIQWILSGRGVAWGVLVLLSSIFLLVVFLAGLFLLLRLGGEPRTIRTFWLKVFWKYLPAILVACLRWSLLLVAALLMLGLVPGLGFLLFLREQDINYYLKSQPPEWWAVLVGSYLWAVGVGALIVRALLRRSLIFPIWVRRGRDLRRAIRDSLNLTRNHLGRMAGLLLLPAAIVFLLHLLVSTLIYFIFEALLSVSFGSQAAFRTAIGGGIFLFMVEYFTMSCAGIAWIAAIWSCLCEYLRPELAGWRTPVPSTGGNGTRTIHAVSLAAVGLVAVVFVVHSVLQAPNLPRRARTLVVAHRGGAGEAPENSLEAYQLAVDTTWADMVEMDVAMTADGVLVLAHDADLMRQADEPRDLADLTWEELRPLVLRTELSRGNQLAPLARLEDVLTVVGKRRPMILEFKQSKRTPQLVEQTVTLVRQFRLLDQVIFMSLNLDDLEAVRAIAPKARVGYFVSVEFGDFMELQLDYIAPRHTLIDRNIIRQARERDVEVLAWTVDDPVRVLELLELGVDAIITNEPTHVRKLVDAYFRISPEARSLLRYRQFWDFFAQQREFMDLAALVEANPEEESGD